MSRRPSSASTHRRRGNPAGRGDGWTNEHSHVATVPAWCEDTESAIDAAKAATHDIVIELLGRARTGGVRWSIQRGPDAIRLLSLMAQDCTDERSLAGYRALGERIHTFGGVVVVAMAPGTRQMDPEEPRG